MNGPNKPSYGGGSYQGGGNKPRYSSGGFQSFDLEAESQKHFNNVKPLLNLYIENANEEHLQAIKKALSDTSELMRICARVKTHQIRNLFMLIKSQKTDHELNLIRPKMMYTGARQLEREGKMLVSVLDKMIMEILKSDPTERERQIKSFHYFMESIVAYHKFFTNEKS